MPPKRYRDVYLREETYQKLIQLKIAFGKRSLNDVIEELLKCFTVNTVSSPVNTVSFTVSTVKPTVSTGDSPVSTVSPTVNTVKHGEDPSNEELSKKLDALDRKLDMLVKELRKQQDLIVAYTGKADQVLQRLSQVVELLQQVAESLRQGSAKVSEKSVESEQKRQRREGTDVCERLRKELVIFESDIADRIRDRDKFFAKIARTCGGIVIEGLRERVAVEKSFWHQFLDKLSKINTSDDEKIKPMLDPLEFRLFTVLKESTLIIYDASEKKWKLSFNPSKSTESSTEASTANQGSGTVAGTDKYRKKHYKKQYEEDESWLLQYMPESEEQA